MVFAPKDEPVLGFPMDEGRFAAIIEIVADEQADFQAQPDLPTAEDAAARMAAYLLGTDYPDALRLVSLATSRALDALLQETGTDRGDEDAVAAMIDAHHESLVTLLFGWLDGVVLGLRYADVSHKKVLMEMRDTDDDPADDPEESR